MGKPLRQAWLFFALTFLISWGLGGAYLLFPGLSAVLGPMNGSSLGFYIVGWAPTLAALILSLAAGTLKDWLGGLVRPFSAVWLVVAALAIPALALFLIAIRPHWPVTPHAVLVELPLVLFATAQIVTNTGPLGEEMGWRGYALPRLMTRWHPVVCALIVGFFWTLWHVPAFFVPGAMAMPFANFGWWALDTFALSLFMTFLFVKARGNVVVAGMIPHFVINGMGRVGAWQSRPAEATGLMILALCLIVFCGMRRRDG